MHSLPLPPMFPPASSFPIPLHPLILLTPPRSHPSISVPTSLKEGRGSCSELVGVVFVDDMAHRGLSLMVTWRLSLVGVVGIDDMACKCHRRQ